MDSEEPRLRRQTLQRPAFALVNTMRLATDTVSAREGFSCPQPPEQRVLAVSEAR
jgi:hypothetical protein